MDTARKEAIAKGFAHLPDVQSATVYDEGECDEVGNVPMVATKLDFMHGSTYLLVAEDVWAEVQPEVVAEFYREVVAQYARKKELAKAA
jgi:hypothetical protein